MKCKQCGGQAPDTAAFCPHCGAQLAADDGDVSEGRATATARLTGRGGGSSNAGRTEDEIWSGTYSPKAMAEWVAGAAILTVLGVIGVAIAGGGAAWFFLIIGLAALWAYIGLVMLYRRMTVRYQLTNYRLFHETGLLSRTRDRIEVIDIDDVTLRQGLIQRMVNVGTIHVQSSDTTHGNLVMIGIEDARRVTDLIDNIRRKERERRGLFMENV